jgi:hypothetical protein
MGMVTVSNKVNQNLTATQKERLQWHWKLGYCNFQWTQASAAKPQDENKQPLLHAKNNISVALLPLYTSCQWAKTSIEFKVEDKDMLLRHNHIEPGDCVSIDQYIMVNP